MGWIVRVLALRIVGRRVFWFLTVVDVVRFFWLRRPAANRARELPERPPRLPRSRSGRQA